MVDKECILTVSYMSTTILKNLACMSWADNVAPSDAAAIS